MTDRPTFKHTRVLRGTSFVCSDCGFFLGDVRVAASLHTLRKEPWAQTPENRAAIEMAERRYPHDKRITPWLLREFRKGRLLLAPPWITDVEGLMNAERSGDQELVKAQNQRLESNRPDVAFFQNDGDPNQDPPIQPTTLQPGMIQNMIRMLDYHRQQHDGFNVMNLTIDQMLPKYEEWKQNNRERDPNTGEVVHSFPDDWTIRRLTDRNDLFNEGEDMQNCIPRYVGSIAQGQHHLFSLRDPQNNPHANVLLEPQSESGDWNGGTVVDIRGKQNVSPTPEYQRYIRNWFNTFNEPPTANFEPGPPGDPGPGHPDDYGIDDAHYGRRKDTWTPVIERQPWIFTADRMEYLRDPKQRPDLQNDAARNWLHHLERTGVHNGDTDILTPFLTKEWKAGRALPTPNGIGFVRPEDRPAIDEQAEALRQEGGYQDAYAPLYAAQYHALGGEMMPQELTKWADFMRSNHSAKRGLDLNNRNTTWRDLHDRYKEYEKWVQKKKDRQSVVHTDPETGTFVKQLTPEDCDDEGTTMNNCINSYGYDRKIAQKRGLLYSVRDKNGNPHIDMEIEPTWMYNPKTGNQRDWQQWHDWSQGYEPDNLDPAEDAKDYQPMPQGGKVIQIHGKNNSPPSDHYQPMLKSWFGSKHFTGPNGEDWRPTWKLNRTHFNDMDQLYSPVRDHVTYYHPGDYGLENPGVTSDYNGLVRTLTEDMRADPENKRLPFLTDWARRHRELGDLEKVVKDPEVVEHMKRYTPEPDPMDHPEYSRWLAANPEPTFDIPQPVGPSCPNCGVDGRMDALPEWVNGTPEIGCNWCGMHMNAEEYPELYQRIENWEPDKQQWQAVQQDHMQNIYNPWLAERNQRAEQAIQELTPDAWENSQPKAMLDQLGQHIDQVRDGIPVVASYQIHTGKWDLVRTANKFNRLRNQLRNNDIWTPENEIIWNHIKSAYPNNENLAEWLHREVRKKRMTSRALSQFARLEGIQNQIADYDREADRLADEGHDGQRYLDASAAQSERLTRLTDQLSDPEWLKAQQLGHTDPETGQGTTVSPELLDQFEDLIKKRKQRKQEANIMKIPTAELIQEAKEAEMAKRARDAGTVVHKFPDNWTMRHIDTGDEARLESEMLGHCMSDYARDIDAGTSHNYSLRDPKGLAHLSLEIKHQRDPIPDWAGLRDLTQGQDFLCPNCGSKAPRGKCENCGFNIQDMQDWMEGDLETKAGIEGRLMDEPDQVQPTKQEYPEGDPRNDKCPHCGSRAKEFENNNIENHRLGDQEGRYKGWFCMNCHNYYPPSRPLTGEEIDNHDGTQNMYTDDPIYMDGRGAGRDPATDKRLPGEWWDKLRPQLNEMKLLHPDLRDGNAYQIQGKENVAPHPKYHRYVREWMGSIPYDERPKAEWSSYYNKTPVLHVDDLEDGGEKGIDDFGFKWEDRPYNWSSIINSLHGGPKQWEDENSVHKKFKAETDPEERGYRPELGQELYDFAKKNNYLGEVAKTIAPWGAPERYPYRNMGEIPCAHCGRKGYLQRDEKDPNIVTCAWCGIEERVDPTYQEQVPPTPEPPPAYSPYQGGLVQHLGPQLAEEPGMYEQIQDQFPKPGQTTVTCPHCGSFNVKDYPGEPSYSKCGDCGKHWRKTTASVVARHTGYHGQPCYCLWHVPDQQRQAKVAKSDLTKIADKFNDYLLNPQARPDLQEPEAQEFLSTLQNRYLNDKTDPLMPWLTREWKKGRILHQPNYGQAGYGPGDAGDAQGTGGGIIQYEGPADYGYEDPINGGISLIHGLHPDDLNHWADWYRSDHPTRQGVDIMKLQTPDLVGRVRDWNNDMRDQAGGQAETKGEIEHTYPDGWTVQRLNKERQLKDEGENMGHCVGGYWPSVRDGNTLIYSLRDHHNEPHATWEITPQEHECAGCGVAQSGPYGGKDPCAECGYVGDTRPSPNRGEMVQVQGKNNEPPKEEYQQRIRDYFGNNFHYGELPRWEEQYVDDADEYVDNDDGYTQYHHGDYGLEPPKIDVDWPHVLDTTMGYGRYADESDVAERAAQLGHLDDLEGAVDEFVEKTKEDQQQNAWDSWMSYAEVEFDRSFAENYPDPDPEDFYDEKGDYDEDAYAKANEEWEDKRTEAKDEAEREYTEEYLSSSEEMEKADNWETAVAQAKYRQRTGVVKRKRHRYHSSFITGEPCRCTFGRAQPETAAPAEGADAATTAKTLTCEVCGNVLEGTHCPLCDWGGWSNAMGEGDAIEDPTKDLKPAIQASWETTAPESRWVTETPSLL